MNIDLATYESGLAPARARLAASRWATEILGPGLSPVKLERFLIHFNSLGVSMIEPLEGWTRRAATRCLELGLADLGRALVAHARGEAGGHHPLIRDTHAMVAHRRRARRATPSPEPLLSRAPTPGIVRFVRLNERTLAGANPYAQIAIEHEIVSALAEAGPVLVRRCEDALGAEIADCITFARGIDDEKARFGRDAIEALLARRPDAVEALIAAGSAGLDAFGAFVDDCVELAIGPAVPAASRGPASARGVVPSMRGWLVEA